jgi:hypothetical protein
VRLFGDFMENKKALVLILLLTIFAAILRAVSWHGPLASSGRALSGVLFVVALVLIRVFGGGRLRL